MARHSSRSAFTLIELLIVIAIIGILMALLFPAVGSAIDAARKAQAKNDVTQFATALVAYETEYGRLPGSNVNAGLIKTLIGTDTDNNPRKISFLEVGQAKKGKSGTNDSGEFVDPWGGVYVIALDNGKDGDTTAYDNQVTAGTNSVTVMKRVAVWSAATYPDTADTNKLKRRAVTSWE